MWNAKYCPKCGQYKPLDEFHRSKRSKDGHVSHCKECVRQYDKQRRGSTEETRDVKVVGINGVNTIELTFDIGKTKETHISYKDNNFLRTTYNAKYCPTCDLVKPLDEFQGSRCGACNNEKSSQFYHENKEQHMEYMLKYRKSHEKELREYHKQYREANKERHAEYQRQYRQTERGKEVEKARQLRRKAKREKAYTMA